MNIINHNEEEQQEHLECPKCKVSIPSNIIKCPTCGNRISSKAINTVDLAHKLAGAILILNSIFLLLEVIFFKNTGDQTGNPASSIIGSIIIGIMLIQGSEKGLYWGRIAVVFGAIIFTGIHLFMQDIFMAAFQIIFSVSLIILLFGKPGKIRILICCIVALGYFGLEGIGIHTEITGKNLLGKVILETTQNLEKIDGNMVNGYGFNYSLQVPSDGCWKLMNRDHMLKQNESANIWIINPDFDAHVMVVAESLDINMDIYTGIIMASAQENISGFEVIDSSVIFR